MKKWILGSVLTWMFLPHLRGDNLVEDVDVQAGCSTASNDLVYIIDGSSSVGTPDFDLAKRWLVNITRGFDVSSRHTQVGVVQYSDTPRLEIPLGKHLSSQELVGAINTIGYLGGNTQTGRAIKFATQHVFPFSNRTQPARNRIAVVLTDGRSQDDVVDAAVEAKAQNIILFAVGVGNEITNSELVSMANKPPSTYVLYAEDYSSIANIRDAMEQKLCEESVCPMQIPGTANVKGFELLSRMQIDMKAKKVQGSLMSETSYLLSPRLDLTDSTRAIFPEGLPPSYVFVATLRLKSPTNHVKLDLIRVLSQDGLKQFAVTLNGLDKSVTFTSTTTSVNKKEQCVIFNDRGIKRLFDSEWHQLKLLVKPRRIICYLDDMQIEEQLLEPVFPIYIKGKIQVAKKVKMEATVPIEIQKLRLYCNPEQSENETACEIYSVEDDRCPLDRQPAAVESCHCPQGKPGSPGLPGPMGFRGEKGREGPPGPDGKPGKPGERGIPGEPGKNGNNGKAGIPGHKGEAGLNGAKGDTGAPGLEGRPGSPGPTGPERQLKLEATGIPGEKGSPGEAGAQGPPGEHGPHGDTGPVGKDGFVGPAGVKGEKGDFGVHGGDGQIGVPGIRGLPGQMGPAGPRGERGPPGQEGLVGPKGPQGLQGPIGPPGTYGIEGSKGAQGARGSEGHPGTPGLNGVEGEQGIQGLPGDRGLPGFKGHKGETGEPSPKGSQGERGNNGVPGNTGANGEAGLKGSKGEKGLSGDTGARGPEGRKGDVGLMGAAGPRGSPGQDGLPGQPGELGYPGKPGKPPTDDHLMMLCANVLRNQLPQLLAMLAPKSQCGQCETVKGPPGEPGPAGPKGPSGTPGYPGTPGLQGYPGQPGRMGPHGHKGDIGPMGLKGSKGDGDTGLTGPPGPAGLQGPRGSDGHGVSGPPGEPGKSGIPGSPGKRGPPGANGVCDPTSCYQAILREERYSKGPNF